MNRLLTFALFALSMAFLTACGGGDATNEEATDAAESASGTPEILQSGTVSFNLSDHQLPVELLIPDTTKGYPEVSEVSTGGVRLTVGGVYDIVIADLIEGDLNSRVTALQEDLMYQNEIVQQGSDFVLYKSTIEGSYVEPEFHFYAIKTIGGMPYEIHDYNEEGGYSERVATMMLESVNHMKAL